MSKPNDTTTKTKTGKKDADAAEVQSQMRPLTPAEAREQTIIGVITVVAIILVAAIIGYAVWMQNKPQDLTALRNDVEAVAVKPEHADDDYSFTISRDGVDKPVAGAPTVTFYMDLMCPGCGNMERNTGEQMRKLVKAGQINLKVHPLSFMDRQSSDGYSTRAALSVINVIELDPGHALDFLAAMYDENFQPEEGADYKPVTDDMIQSQAVKAGVGEETAKRITDRRYEAWLKAETAYTTARPDLMDNNQFSTPVITVNGVKWNWRAVDGNENMGDALVKALGLDPAKAGDENAKPTIGDTGAPVYPK